MKLTAERDSQGEESRGSGAVPPSRMRAETQDLLSARRTENLAEEERALNWDATRPDGDAASTTA